MDINAATACLPGRSFRDAVAQLVAGIHEPAWGTLGTAHIQLCPQHPDPLDEAAVDALQAMAPGTRFRPHANVLLGPRRQFFDASTFDSDAHIAYFTRLGVLARRMEAPAYSLHAGYRHQATRERMRDNVLRVQDLLGVPTAVEALYPVTAMRGQGGKRPQLLDSWSDLEWLMASDLGMAIDLSHLAIIASVHGRRDDLVRDLLRHPRLLEIHVSDNDGRRDEHRQCGPDGTWWYRLLAEAELAPDCTVFSEGNADRPPLTSDSNLNRRTRAKGNA